MSRRLFLEVLLKAEALPGIRCRTGERSCIREIKSISRSMRISCSEPNGSPSFSVICSTDGIWRGEAKHCRASVSRWEIISRSVRDQVSIRDSKSFMEGEDERKEATTRLGAFFPMDRIA